MNCEHTGFESAVSVIRLTDGPAGKVVGFSAEIRIRCAHCGIKFQFVGMPLGSSPAKPTCSIDALEARMPICPEGSRPKPLDEMLSITGALGGGSETLQ